MEFLNAKASSDYFHGSGYYDYPAGSDSVIGCAAPTAAPNRANCNSAAGGVADVGSYPGSPSPSGTLDQGGNFFEWTEAADGAARSLRGGAGAAQTSRSPRAGAVARERAVRKARPAHPEIAAAPSASRDRR